MQYLVLREDKTKYELCCERRFHLNFIKWVCRLEFWENPDKGRDDQKPSISQP
jgi:hypothetical protein